MLDSTAAPSHDDPPEPPNTDASPISSSLAPSIGIHHLEQLPTRASLRRQRLQRPMPTPDVSITRSQHLVPEPRSSTRPQPLPDIASERPPARAPPPKRRQLRPSSISTSTSPPHPTVARTTTRAPTFRALPPSMSSTSSLCFVHPELRRRLSSLVHYRGTFSSLLLFLRPVKGVATTRLPRAAEYHVVPLLRARTQPVGPFWPRPPSPCDPIMARA